MKKTIISALLCIPMLLSCGKVNTPVAINHELVNEWSTSGTVFANYVDASGNYIGDASINENCVYQFKSDGTYQSFYATTTNFKTKTFYYKGTYTIDGNLLTTTPTFYEHKLNTALQPNNDPNNMKVQTVTFAIYTDDQTQQRYLLLDEANGGGWTRLYKAQ
jgi:hypothetical protein